VSGRITKRADEQFSAQQTRRDGLERILRSAGFNRVVDELDAGQLKRRLSSASSGSAM
jgi:hypothetical protein